MNMSDTSWHDDLLAAALKGDANIIEDKIHEDPSHIHATFELEGLSSPDNPDDEATLLDIALRFQHQEMALVLIQEQDAYTELASSNAIDLAGLLSLPPLHSANLKDALSLVASGTDPNVKDARGNTCLHTAAADNDTTTITSFLQVGADINAQNARGRTPLHMAVLNGALKAVQVLSEAGADVTMKDTEGNTPLSLAFDREDNIHYNFDVFDDGALEICSEMSDVLVAAEVNKRTYQLFLSAVENNDLASVEKMLREENIELLAETYPAEMMPLQIAAKHGHDEIVRLLLESGADVDAGSSNYNGDYETPLMLATRVSTIRILLDAGATLPDAFFFFYYCDDEKKTGFNAGWLLEAGISVNQQDDDGGTLLHAAVHNADAPGIKALLAAGADVNARNEWNSTPFHRAFFCDEDALQTLLQAGADKEARNNDQQTPLLASLDIGEFDDGESYGNNYVRCLLSAGVNFDVHDDDGNTPLHLIGHMDEIDPELAERVVKLTTDLNAVNSKGETPLSIALADENTCLAGLLLAAGATGAEDVNNEQ